MTIVVVTHELESAFRIADRIAVLREGEIVVQGTLDELLSQGGLGVEVEFVGSAPWPAYPAQCRLVWEDEAQETARWWVPGDSPAQINAVLQLLIDSGMQIRAVQPRRQGLEAFFAAAMGWRSGPAGAGVREGGRVGAGAGRAAPPVAPARRPGCCGR